MAKIKLGELIQALQKEVSDADASDMPQGEKTKRYKAAASRFKNALFTDKRKYRGKTLEKRITAGTYSNYMARARKRFDDLLHHHFEANIHRLAAKYPLYANELNEWLTLPAADIRRRYSDLLEHLKSILSLAEDLTGIKPAVKANAGKLARIAKKYPSWEFAVLELADEDGKAALAHLHKLFQQGRLLLEDISKLRINHDVLYSLQLSAAERNSLQQRADAMLSEKKRNTILIDYPVYMQAIHELVETAPEKFNNGTRVGMAPLAFALAAVSGRRMIEIMYQGEFEVTGPNTVEFLGQAKKRSDDGRPRTIYTLCDAGLFVSRVNALRGFAAVADFDDVVEGYGALDTRSENGRLNAVLAKAFNPWVKRFFNDGNRVYKDSRAIYARIAYETWFRHDPRWESLDEDVFFAEILGHDDENTQLHYKQFKLHNFSRTWHRTAGNENRRLLALQRLDDVMPDFARGDAGIRLHEEVKKVIEETPDALINSNMLRKMKFNPKLVARYLELAASALGQVVGENGQYQLQDTSPPMILNVETHADELDDEEDEDDESLDDDEIDTDEDNIESPEQAKESKPEKPRFGTTQRRDDGTWKVVYEFCGKEYSWVGPADNIRDAMLKAWEACHG